MSILKLAHDLLTVNESDIENPTDIPLLIGGVTVGFFAFMDL